MSHPAVDDPPHIIDFAPEHAHDFRALNSAWITSHFVLEAPDHAVLDAPHAAIIAPGGAILMATLGGRVVGTCALIAEGDGLYELAKMAVADDAQGRGIGRALGTAAIVRARRLGAHRVELLSNAKLVAAVALYRSLGFRHVPVPASPYQRTDVKMVLDLSTTSLR